ncbi:potassium/sodium hyperpolarization-activated cyclic nucleotide-gated channel 1-like isoform X3 [Oscarella lobularis]|uniref:potassium/sodium hyperpolarization-activated cyclic nucleotide-gated channel 1-like isoform X3 n=1 Tax=Oscarella lobularis TaxID=121494 RepID=UPI0033138278
MATHSSGVETSKSTRTTGNVLNRFSSFFRNIRRPNQCAPEEKSTNDDEEKGRYNLSRATIGRSMPSLPISRFRSSAQMLGNLEEEDEENEEAENQSPSQTFPPFKIARLNRRGGSHLLDLNVPKKKSTTFITSWFSVADNKMSLKLFGSRRAIESEQERQQRSSPWIIHPCSVFRMYWDILTLIILALNLILLPLVIAFFSDQKLSTHWIVLNSLTDIVFLLDVVVNFRTGFLTDGHSHEIVNLDSKAIAIRYLKTWFVLDAVASLPIDNIVNIFLDDESYSDNVSHLLRASKALKVLRLAKLLSLLRLLRLSRLMRFFDQWEEIFNITKAVFRILKLIGMMLLLAHWSGCLQYMVPYLQGFPEDSWVAINHLQNAPVGTAYTWSLFKSLSHMLCIGYGRFPPMNVSDAWLTIISMMIGASFYALFIGHISSHVLTANSPSRLYQQKCVVAQSSGRVHALSEAAHAHEKSHTQLLLSQVPRKVFQRRRNHIGTLRQPTNGTGQLQLQRSRPIGSPIPRRRSVLRTADRHSTPLRGLSPGRRHRPSGNDRTQNVLHTRGNRRRDRRTRRRLHVAHRRFLFRRNMPTPSQSTLGDDQGDHRLRSLLAFDGTLQRRSRRVSRHTIGDGESRRRAARQTD